MARKRITAVRLSEDAPAVGWQLGHIDRVVWVEDGKAFPQEQPRETVARAANAGEPFYVRAADGTEVAVRAQLRHGRYYLTAVAGAAQPELLLTLPVHVR